MKNLYVASRLAVIDDSFQTSFLNLLFDENRGFILRMSTEEKEQEIIVDTDLNVLKKDIVLDNLTADSLSKIDFIGFTIIEKESFIKELQGKRKRTK